MIYVGRTLLGYRTDEEVWLLTPKYLYSQMKVHFDLESQKWGGKSTRNPEKNNEPTGFIDTIPGWR